MSDSFRVCLRGEFYPPADELFFEIKVVFDDPVVHNDHVAGAMWVRVGFRRPAVSRPARVADADRSGQWIPSKDCFQITELTFATPHHDLAIVHDGDPSGIIAPVLKLPQAL